MCGNNAGAMTAGPSAYGFTDAYCLPTNTATQLYNPLGSPMVYPSPDGSAANEGCGGGLPDGTNVSGESLYVANSIDGDLTITPPHYLALGDGAIADAFSIWLSSPPPANKPWFCAVSFVNPHDMSGFPYAYGLAGVNDPTGQGAFGSPDPKAAHIGYVPPPSPYGPQPPSPPTHDTIAALTTTTYPPNGTAPVGPLPNQPLWNNADDPSKQAYVIPPANGVYGKPTLQWYYQDMQGHELGVVGLNGDQNGWFTFLNYYFWMQANVDIQIGRVINALGPSFANTVIVFLSDHGDYAGSHAIHGKAWALYDESINAPLYIKLVQQKKKLVLPNACSSVDILPFLYSTALGNDSWRQNPNDLVAYLYNREAINDFINGSNPVQRRVSTNQQTLNPYQPYVLHTTDEGFSETLTFNGQPVPSHAIAFRTVDVAPGSVAPYGGGKLGIYSFWNYTTGGAACPPPIGNGGVIPPTQPDLCAGAQQFEFYNYSSVPPVSQDGVTLPLPLVRYGETQNQVQFDPTGKTMQGVSGMYQTNFGLPSVQNELYTFTTYNGSPAPQYIIGPSGAYSTALATYLAYVKAAQAGQTPAETTWQK